MHAAWYVPVQALSRQRAEAAAFDSSRLVDFAERVRYAGPAAQLSPLVRFLFWLLSPCITFGGK